VVADVLEEGQQLLQEEEIGCREFAGHPEGRGHKVSEAHVAHSHPPGLPKAGGPAATLHSSPGALSQQSGLLSNRQAAAHTYAFSSAIFSSFLGCSMAAIHSS